MKKRGQLQKHQSRCNTLPLQRTARDPIPVDPSNREPPMGQKIYVSMAVDEDYEDDTATFAYNGLRVPITKSALTKLEGLFHIPEKVSTFSLSL